MNRPPNHRGSIPTSVFTSKMPHYPNQQQKTVAQRNQKGPRPGLIDLPMEIINMIAAENIQDVNDLNSFSRVNKAFFRAYQYHVITAAFNLKVQLVHDRTDIVLGLFFHAARHDSVRIARILTGLLEGMSLTGYIPVEPFGSKRITFFHHALIADAPMLATHLAAEAGNMFDESLDFYPGIAPIYHALFPRAVATQEVLDKALRNACIYGLARTANALLACGADVMAMNPFGLMPIHLALSNRRPWWDLDRYQGDKSLNFDIRSNVHHMDWEAVKQSTIAALLKFSCPVDLRSAQLRRHKCDHKCFRSLDCDHHEQTPLHMAARIDFGNIVSYLLCEGANPYGPNGEGYTALYCALVQESWAAVDALLKYRVADVNPIVHVPTGTTALHIASRFAMPSMVNQLLQAGADPNVTNSCGLTPLHEVLCQTQPGRDGDVYLVLKCLARFSADPATPSTAPRTPWDMAKNHPFPDVQEMFANRTLLSFWELDSERSNSNNSTKGAESSGSDSVSGVDSKKTDPGGNHSEHEPHRRCRQRGGRARGNQGTRHTENDVPSQPITNSFPTRSVNQTSGITTSIGAEDVLIDFGDDLILFETEIQPETTGQNRSKRVAATDVRPKPKPTAPLQMHIVGAGWRPKLLILNDRPKQSNALHFPETASRDAVKRAVAEDASRGSQETKKGQPKKNKKWTRLQI